MYALQRDKDILPKQKLSLCSVGVLLHTSPAAKSGNPWYRENLQETHYVWKCTGLCFKNAIIGSRVRTLGPICQPIPLWLRANIFPEDSGTSTPSSFLSSAARISHSRYTPSPLFETHSWHISSENQKALALYQTGFESKRDVYFCRCVSPFERLLFGRFGL